MEGFRSQARVIAVAFSFFSALCGLSACVSEPPPDAFGASSEAPSRSEKTRGPGADEGIAPEAEAPASDSASPPPGCTLVPWRTLFPDSLHLEKPDSASVPGSAAADSLVRICEDPRPPAPLLKGKVSG